MQFNHRFSSVLLSAFLLLTACCLQEGALAQDVNGSPDSVSSLLCHKWVMAYMLSDGLRMVKSPDMPDLVYVFQPDHGFVRTRGDAPADKGEWVLDRRKKQIVLRSAGKPLATVISLAPGELILTDQQSRHAAQNLKMIFAIGKD
jgi:hypothetical protein